MISVIVRISQAYDMDLMWLIEQGYPVRRMIRKAVRAYLDGEIYQIAVEPMQSLSSYHRPTRMDIRFTEPDEVALFTAIQPHYRNRFCLMLLRNSIVFSGYGVFIKSNESKWVQHDREVVSIIRNHLGLSNEIQTPDFVSRSFGIRTKPKKRSLKDTEDSATDLENNDSCIGTKSAYTKENKKDAEENQISKHDEPGIIEGENTADEVMEQAAQSNISQIDESSVQEVELTEEDDQMIANLLNSTFSGMM